MRLSGIVTIHRFIVLEKKLLADSGVPNLRCKRIEHKIINMRSADAMNINKVISIVNKYYTLAKKEKEKEKEK